jgi:hypothetical protein
MTELNTRLNNSKRTKSQSALFHKLLKEIYGDDMTKKEEYDIKRNLSREVSQGRTTKSSALYVDEMSKLIKKLTLESPSNKMRRKIIGLFRDIEMKRIGGGEKRKYVKEDGKININAIDGFLLKRGVVKKKFTTLSKEELTKTVTQIEQMM